VALSLADLACGDAWDLPDAMRGKAAARVLESIGEARCASETLETLVVDAKHSDRRIQSVAMDRAQFQTLLDVLAGYSPALVTAAPLALAEVFDPASFTCGGEAFSIADEPSGRSARAFPSDSPDTTGALNWNGASIPFEDAVAFAAAVCDPEQVPNLLNTQARYRKTFARRFRDPLVSVAAAAALCLGALGVRFHRDVVREREELAAARRAELELWARYLPSQEPREGRLLRSLRERLDDLGESAGAAEFPSALAFWGEIGKQMPDPEALGLTLESLDLAPDGGRISARLPAAKDDPLKNASQLEAKFNQSSKMTARGDYEVRDGQVQVRLRMDYKP
jgi:hypothetical protein